LTPSSFEILPVGETIVEPDVVLYPATDASNAIEHRLDLIRSGQGEVKVDPDQLGGCGTVRFIVSCPSMHNPTPFLEHCNRLACPVCYQTTCASIARRIAERTDEFPKALKRDRNKIAGDLKHIVLSVPLFDPDRPEDGSSVTEPDLIADGGKSLRRHAVKILKKYANDSFFAGTLIFHPWRKKHVDDGSECEDPNCKDREHYWHWAPHFHFLGYGFFAPGDQIYLDTGWVFKRIEEEDGFDRNAYETARYQMSHAGIFVTGEDRVLGDEDHERVVRAGAQVGLSYHYVGAMSNSKFGHEVTDRRQEECKCTECQQTVMEYHEVEPGIPDVHQENATPHLVWITEKRWYIVIRKLDRNGFSPPVPHDPNKRRSSALTPRDDRDPPG